MRHRHSLSTPRLVLDPLLNSTGSCDEQAESLVAQCHELPVRLSSAIEALQRAWDQCLTWDALLDSQAHSVRVLFSIMEVSEVLEAIELNGLKYKVYRAFHSDKTGQVTLLSYSLLFRLLPLYSRIEETVEMYLNLVYDCLLVPDLPVGRERGTASTSQTGTEETEKEACSELEPTDEVSDPTSLPIETDTTLAESPDTEASSVPNASNSDLLFDSVVASQFAHRPQTPSISSEDAAEPDSPVSPIPVDSSTGILPQQVSHLITVLSRPDLSSSPRTQSAASHGRSRPAMSRSNTSGSEIVEAGWYRLVTESGITRDVYCRIVGAIVMVRVGGGWLDMKAFLESWSAHHRLVAQPKKGQDAQQKKAADPTSETMSNKTKLVPQIAKLCKSKDGTLKVMSWHSLDK